MTAFERMSNSSAASVVIGAKAARHVPTLPWGPALHHNEIHASHAVATLRCGATTNLEPCAISEGAHHLPVTCDSSLLAARLQHILPPANGMLLRFSESEPLRLTRNHPPIVARVRSSLSCPSDTWRSSLDLLQRSSCRFRQRGQRNVRSEVPCGTDPRRGGAPIGSTDHGARTLPNKARTLVASDAPSAPQTARKAKVRGVSVGNQFVSSPSNPSRPGGSVGSSDSSKCTTADTILANATRTNLAPKSIKVAAGMIRSGGGADTAPAKHTSKISRDDETEDVVHHHAPRQTSDSCTPNLAMAGDSGGRWPICKGSFSTEGRDNNPGTSVNLT